MARGLLTKLRLGHGCLPNLPPMGNGLIKLWKTEDWWAVWLGLGIVRLGRIVFARGGVPADHEGFARPADVPKSKAQMIGVLVNVPLGYILSTIVFSRYWSQI